MRKYIAALGLVGLLGVGYWVACRSGAETALPSVKAESVKENDKAETHLTPISAYSSQARSQSYLMEYDQYRDYVNSKEIIPFWLETELFRPDVQQWCNEKEILRKHEEISQRIPHDETDHDFFWDLDALIALDHRLANCKYKGVPQRYRELLLELVEHFESRNNYKTAGQILYTLGEMERAREFFLQNGGAVEFLLKMTPPEELPALTDYYLQQGALFSAGKVEWFQGNRDLGRALIEQSKYYQETMEEVKIRLSNGSYKGPAYTMWELSLPFHWELVRELCSGNVECLQMFEKYKPF